MVSASESPIHDNWKRAIVAAAETGTVFVRQEKGPALRALRTERTTRLEGGDGNPMAELAAGVRDVYFDGNLEGGVALSGQVAGRIEEVRPVADIIQDTVREFFATVEGLAKRHLAE
jgi:enoyl-[acyl-carrier protein] reductase II